MTSAIAPAPAGRLWRFGDNIDTDAMAPAVLMKSPLPVLARHCLASLRPEFPGSVRAGDVLVAGANFGIGSSREQAAEALKHLGVAAVLARSFGGIFYRNALNLGLPVLVCEDIAGISAGDLIHVDAATGVIDNRTSGTRLSAAPLPPFLLAMIADGGLVPHLEKRFADRRAAART